MIQINLMPDVKREYIKAQQMKHTVLVLSILLSIAIVTVAGLLFGYVRLIQPQHRANLQTDIDTGLTRQRDYPDGVEMVTVQGVLEQIGPIQDKKLITSRLFNYVTDFTPRGVVYNSIAYDSAAGTLTLSGRTTTYEKANELANNVKSAEFSYEQSEQESTINPFSGLVFTSLAAGDEAEDGMRVSFGMTFQIDATLFNQAIRNGNLTVNASSRDLLTPSRDPLFTENEVDPEALNLEEIQP